MIGHTAEESDPLSQGDLVVLGGTERRALLAQYPDELLSRRDGEDVDILKYDCWRQRDAGLHAAT